MTKEEIEKAYKDDTWLVDTECNSLVRIGSKVSGGVYSRWAVVYGGGDYWVHEKNLRIATAKDLVELSND